MSSPRRWSTPIDSVPIRSPRFSRRCSHDFADFIPDDAPRLLDLHSDSCPTLFSALYIIGNYPWSSQSSPTVLYSFPSDDSLGSSYASFLLPDGCRYSSHNFHSSSELFQYLYDPLSTLNGQFFILYFPETPAPYLFSYRFRVGPLTLPTFAHSLSLPDLLSHMSSDSSPTTEICLAFKTRFPFFELFVNLIRWVLESEMVARMEVCDLVERSLSGQSHGIACSWPHATRDRLIRNLCALSANAPPDPDGDIVIDSPPSRVFQWRRPRVKKNHYPLGSRVLSDVVRHLNQRRFTQLFSALLLEKTIVVYHPDERVVNHIVLAMHFMLRPLRWVSGSVSILPVQLMDLLNAPNPLLVGTVLPITELQPWFVYFDLIAQDVRVVDRRFLLFPRYAEMEKTLRHVWGNRAQEKADYTQILEYTNGAVYRFLEPVAPSIMSELAEGEVHSRFCHDLYLPRFPEGEREFVEAFCATQMFQVQVEQDCRRRSDSLRGGARK